MLSARKRSDDSVSMTPGAASAAGGSLSFHRPFPDYGREGRSSFLNVAAQRWARSAPNQVRGDRSESALLSVHSMARRPDALLVQSLQLCFLCAREVSVVLESPGMVFSPPVPGLRILLHPSHSS